MSIDDRQLRYFVDVATFRSINKAAEYRNIAQPALSRRMRQLEHDLSTTLFIRQPQGIELTDAGQRLLVRAASLIGEFDRIREAMSDDEKGPEIQLRVGLPPGVSLLLLDRMVSEVYRTIAKVILEIKEAETRFLLNSVLEGDLDIAVVSRRDFSPRIEAQRFYSEPLFFAVHPSLSQPPSEVTLPFAVPDSDETFNETAYDCLRRLGRPPQIDMRLATISSIKRLVDRAQACTLGPYSALTEEIRTGHWSLTRVPGVLLERYLVWRKGEDSNPLVQQMRRVFLTAIASATRDETGDLLVPTGGEGDT
ncbi:LysR family transcriptional regulator [Bradyrhizobium sp. Ce-3]|uniref:LysR family transcriptional regulator n=1 Tax=Bradyrhizobium sp. Ce-3 TaxID=2913970 RepID=UPI001FC873BB|nr:LysR family transcriptional regulator [Bradyrhizobium sp. Ce-3]GKQ55126.1 LysR family transcriptional regulator [Bradyrhizobium sp. Ce-3]